MQPPAPDCRGYEMKKLTPDDPEGRSPDIAAENLAKLKALFPAIVTEGPKGASVNVDVLKALVGDGTVSDAEEKYGLNWHGKRRARQLALTPSTGTLRPCPEESVDWDTTQNLMIEGDNLEVLKLLQKSYAGRVRIICIDPPYNTGNDFVYPDDFQDAIGNYLALTGQALGGVRLATNSESSGRFHTSWLAMIYPRLYIARSLLARNGVVFVHIDDNELQNLLALCREIFGEDNHVATFVWEKKRKASNLDSQVRSITEYIVCFRREQVVSLVASEDVAEEHKPYPFYNTGNKRQVLSFPGGYVVTTMPDGRYRTGRYEDNKTHVLLLDDVLVEGGRLVGPFRLEGEWRYSQKSLDELIAAGRRIEIKGAKFKPYYINNESREKFVRTLLAKDTYGVGTNEDGNAEMAAMFGDDIFSFPKPVSLLRKLIEIVCDEDALVLDFFAGSGTTGQAVLEQNARDGGQRRFVLVQLPEPLDPGVKEQKGAADCCDGLHRPRNLAELTKERLRRAAKKIKDENPMFAGDLGFRVFKLDSTNLQEWKPNPDDLDGTLLKAVDHVKADRTEADLLYEVLLKLGLDLCVPIEARTIAGKAVQSVGGGVLMACLAEKITREDVEALGQGIVDWRKALAPAGDTTCIFRDAAFADDVAKTNLASILEQNGIKKVRSL